MQLVESKETQCIEQQQQYFSTQSSLEEQHSHKMHIRFVIVPPEEKQSERNQELEGYILLLFSS